MQADTTQQQPLSASTNLRNSHPRLASHPTSSTSRQAASYAAVIPATTTSLFTNASTAPHSVSSPSKSTHAKSDDKSISTSHDYNHYSSHERLDDNKFTAAISKYFDMSREQGGDRLFRFLITASMVWLGIKAIFAIVDYARELAEYKDTGRVLYDYPYLWVLVTAAIYAISLMGYSVVMLRRKNKGASNSTSTVTGLYMQTIVCGVVLVYADRLRNGSYFVVPCLSLAAALFQCSGTWIGIGWGTSTAAIVTMMLSEEYFPSFLRFDTRHHSILSAIVYTFTSLMIAAVPRYYSTWLDEARRDQHHLSKLTSEVVELLITMKTDEALRVILEAEVRLGGHVGADSEGGDALLSNRMSGAHGSVLTVLKRLTVSLSRYRSYLPNSLFLEGGGQNFDDNDEDSDEDREGDDNEENQERQRSREDLDGGGGGGLVDPYAWEKSPFRRRWSSILYVAITSPVDDPTLIQGISEKFCEAVIPQVEGSRGVVDRLGPTSILASFNCHTPCVIHESEASHCALRIAAELSQYSGEFVFSIVVASGYNFVGTCGVDTHRARVVIGESVDVVQKLMPLVANTLCCRIVLTEDTANKVGLETAPIDAVMLKRAAGALHSEKPITLFELRSARRENAPLALSTAFSAAFASFRSGDYTNALHLFSNYVERNPTDTQARRLAALCEPLAKELGSKLKASKSRSQVDSPMPSSVTLVPYCRNELLWDSWTAEEQFVTNQKRSEMISGGGGSASAGSGVAVGGSERAAVTGDLGDTVRQHFQTQKLDYQEDGLVSMFLPADEEVEEGGSGELGNNTLAPNEDNVASGVFTQHDALSTEVPRSFDDANRKRWRRSSNVIGEGAFASLYLALGELGDLVAMKCFNLANQKTQVEELIRELNTLSSLRNDYIVGYVGYAVTPNHFVILMEYVSGGSLHQMLQQFGPLPITAAKRYLIDILKGLRYLHDNQTTHCDIKPHNALLANDGTCKLSDFGSSVNMQQVQQRQLQQQQQYLQDPNNPASGYVPDDQLMVRGTSWYLAPEAAKGEICPANDVWSLGITFIEMITGKHPWTFRGSEAAFIITIGKDESMVPPMSADIPLDAQQFLSLCFQRDPTKRPTTQLLLQHPFLT